MSLGILRLAQVGLGPIGCAIARLAASRGGLELVGAADPAPDLSGRDLGELLGLGPLGVTVVRGVEEMLEAARPDVVLHATGSFLPEVADQLRAALRAGASVVSTCEELAYPFYRHPELARELDRLAAERGVALLGAGVNPGFVMDKLACTLVSACAEVERVLVRRVVDVSKRRGPLQRKVGAGLTPGEFEDRKARREVGHIGLAESAHMLADVIGLPREGRSLREELRPRLAGRPLRTEHVRVEPGQVAGIEQLASVEAEGRERVRLELRMDLEAAHPEDRISVRGSPPLELTVEGGIPGDEGTAALVVNCVCLVRELRPGLRTVLDVPLRFSTPPR